MGQFGQTNDLQEAIDQVSNNTKNKNSSTEIDQIQTQFGIPPMPESAPAAQEAAPFSDILPNNNVPETVTPVTAPIDIVNPVVPDTAKNTPSAEQILSAEILASPKNEENTNVIEPQSTPAPEKMDDANMEMVRENILRELMPLMNEVDGTPEEKFKLYKEAINSLHEKSLVSDAFTAASQIEDKSAKAHALMDLMQILG